VNAITDNDVSYLDLSCSDLLHDLSSLIYDQSSACV
jgi:hypothetical protein